jgi:proteasome lid subunit RPN8/RPN11
MKIRPADAEAIAAHARAGYPHEVCGVLVGSAGGDGIVRVARVVPVTNRETERPAVRYQIAPEDLIAVQRAARGDGLDIVGYFHSHPDHPARPSETDRRIAAEGLSDGVVHVVCGVANGKETVATAWVFRDASQGFEEEPFDVE